MKMDDIIVRTIDKAIIILGIVGLVLLGISLFYNSVMASSIFFFTVGLVVSCTTIRVWLTSKFTSKISSKADPKQ